MKLGGAGAEARFKCWALTQAWKAGTTREGNIKVKSGAEGVGGSRPSQKREGLIG